MICRRLIPIKRQHEHLNRMPYSSHTVTTPHGLQLSRPRNMSEQQTRRPGTAPEDTAKSELVICFSGDAEHGNNSQLRVAGRGNVIRWPRALGDYIDHIQPLYLSHISLYIINKLQHKLTYRTYRYKYNNHILHTGIRDMLRTGRPTTDKKSESIRIRLNDEMREYIERKSKSTGKSISEIFREYVHHDMLSQKF